MPKSNKSDNREGQLLTIYKTYKDEAKAAKHERMAKNKINFDCYHLKQDWSHKIDGQSTEFLPKMAMATEQASNFFEQGLVDTGAWFRTEAASGVDKQQLPIKAPEIQKIMAKMFKDISFVNTVGDVSKLGLLGSLMILKVHGKIKSTPRFVFKEGLKDNNFQPKLEKEEHQAWELAIETVRQEDYYPDPTGKGLYELHDTEMDLHEVIKMSKGDNAIYDPKAVETLKGSTVPVDEQRAKKANETGQSTVSGCGRPMVKITELWGTIVDSTTGEVLHENIVMTIANDKTIIQKPTPNPFWHGRSPFVTSPIISVPNSVWHKALMDAPAALNKAINELSNLILDGGLMSVHGIKQLRPNWLEDESQVSNGIPAGTTLKASASCPPNGKVLERVDTSTVPQDGLSVLNLFNQEHNAAAITNDLRSGVQSFRAVKATEVVEAGNSITSMFTGMVKKIESKLIDVTLEKSWMTIAQHIKMVDEAWLASCVGEERAAAIKKMSAQQIFAGTVNGTKFKTFGISQILKQKQEFAALQALLQIITGSEALTEAYLSDGNSLNKLLGEILKALDIQEDRLKEEQDPQTEQLENAVSNQGGPDTQSQQPQAGSERSTPNQTGLPSEAFATNPNQ